MDIIALFCGIDHFLFFRDKQIVAYSKGSNSVGWDLYAHSPKEGKRGLKPRRILNKAFLQA